MTEAPTQPLPEPTFNISLQNSFHFDTENRSTEWDSGQSSGESRYPMSPRTVFLREFETQEPFDGSDNVADPLNGLTQFRLFRRDSFDSPSFDVIGSQDLFGSRPQTPEGPPKTQVFAFDVDGRDEVESSNLFRNFDVSCSPPTPQYFPATQVTRLSNQS